MIRDQVDATAASSARSASQPLEALADLGRFGGSPAEFWPIYLATLGQCLSVRRSLLLLRSPDAGWRAACQWPAQASGAPTDATVILSLAESSSAQAGSSGLAAQAGVGLGARLRSLPEHAAAGSDAAALVLLCEGGDAALAARLPLLRLAVETTEQYAMGRRLLSVASNAERLHEAADLARRLGDEERFLKAAMTLCGELAARFACDRVSLGWLEGEQVRLRSVSNIEKFDRSMAAAQALEDVMEEALDQDCEIVVPAPADHAFVARSHLDYARAQGVAHVLSLPLRVGGQVRAVLTAERRLDPFDEAQRWEMRLSCELVASRLATLQQRERWLGARWADAAGQALGALWGVDHSLAKLITLSTVLAVLVAAVLPWSYRIDTAATLRSEEMVFVPAPFDGFLREVHVEVGDPVTQGTVTVGLDTRELLLEESMAAAEVARFGREAEKARAVGQLADMQIALARQNQFASRLELVRDHLSQAKLRAPMTGVVVEGELKKSLGGPVKKGDLLLKIARLDSTYIELEIDQTDIHEAAPGRRGELALVGRPDLKVALVIERIEPMSTMKDGRNYFLARARIDGPVQSWWRPGMGGTAKVEAGERSLLWVLTHRTLRFLQRTLWL
jgi:multidrug efflux pump subunit AcrA (membrane-fusion protein)